MAASLAACPSTGWSGGERCGMGSPGEAEGMRLLRPDLPPCWAGRPAGERGTGIRARAQRPWPLWEPARLWGGVIHWQEGRERS